MHPEKQETKLFAAVLLLNSPSGMDSSEEHPEKQETKLLTWTCLLNKSAGIDLIEEQSLNASLRLATVSLSNKVGGMEVRHLHSVKQLVPTGYRLFLNKESGTNLRNA